MFAFEEFLQPLGQKDEETQGELAEACWGGSSWGTPSSSDLIK